MDVTPHGEFDPLEENPSRLRVDAMSPKESPLQVDVVPTSSPISVQQYRLLVEERREASRFGRESGTDFAVIWRESGEELLVEVQDESLTGLGILVESSLGLEVGSRLNVVYTGEYLDGEVRHIQQDGEQLRVGLRCRRMIRDGAAE